ncbi:beta-fructofuranosidase, insoluble isoenzyme 1-like [Olea europaea subsp. europaea]|uniref:Beta-fructofuranosidase, insoluble isoenzyme 1-like n=1 Tax=Olea europaea subsp. europaea TaxID=158383 RepID=A0A8S0RSV6_OLEEU|nr:beta-fructofuranosidase, insoluble isoenzyme 1-like [Olea europaea subsp. europaea]
MEGNNIKHVLEVSLDGTRYDYCTLGTYFPQLDRGLRYNYGNFYASKSFFDPVKKRRIMWAWANESDITLDDVEKGWSGILTSPQTILIYPNKRQLLKWPIEELETLRRKKVELREKKLKNGEHVEVKGITAARADVEVTFSFHSLDKAEKYDFCWDETFAAKRILLFKVGSSLKEGLYRPSFAGFVDVDLTDKKLSLRSLIDHSVVESFGAGGKTCITSRVCPTLAVYENAHLHAFNNGTETFIMEKLDAWSMNSPQMN